MNVMRFLLLLLWLPALAAMAQDWKVDYGKSQIHFLITEMNVPVEGGFKRYSAQARFDPAKMENAAFRVDLDVASIDTGSAEGDDEAQRPLWFDTAHHPTASFVSSSVQRMADGRYSARGKLIIKGRSKVMTVPFSLVPQPGGGWLAEGHFTLSRADFGIGGGDWNDVVADQAEARFRIWLTP
jgi:polyisoprenoid-binding protein YceI